MDESFQIELAQLPGIDGDVDANMASALAAVEACDARSRLLVLPELHLTGFPIPSNVRSVSEPVGGPRSRALCEAARKRGISIAFGMSESANDRYYNTTVLATPTEGIVLAYRKMHLFGIDRDVFTPGDQLTTVVWNGLRVGLLICYDIEFPEAARGLAQIGAQLLIVTNGNMDPYGPVHHTSVHARAAENQVFAVMANRVGDSAHDWVFAGGSAAVDPCGRTLVEAGRSPCTLRVTIDPAQLIKAKRHFTYLDDRRFKLDAVEIDDAPRKHLKIRSIG
jgi:(R)-amidase